jgi:hypothetical protein
MELDVLQFVRFINQVNPNHKTDLNSENTTNLSRTTLFPCLSVHFHLVDDLGHSINPAHSLLGDLFFVEAKEPTSQEKNAVFALTRNPSQDFVGAVL